MCLDFYLGPKMAIYGHFMRRYGVNDIPCSSLCLLPLAMGIGEAGEGYATSLVVRQDPYS
jgi:hypothetical protein